MIGVERGQDFILRPATKTLHFFFAQQHRRALCRRVCIASRRLFPSLFDPSASVDEVIDTIYTQIGPFVMHTPYIASPTDLPVAKKGKQHAQTDDNPLEIAFEWVKRAEFELVYGTIYNKYHIAPVPPPKEFKRQTPLHRVRDVAAYSRYLTALPPKKSKRGFLRRMFHF